ncbi:ABC transporter ATP-binding protein [Vibrio sp. WXL210]|uniref:ABC transporter ATP-binding protein n=1 Tax=Vibrio sp. WXL210 TaxID=3450709 RepID=UPI003EC694E4
MSDFIVEIESLTIQSSSAKIVDDLSLSLHLGVPVTILGETGSGKSILAQAIMGALPEGLTSQGSVKVFGRDVQEREYIESLWGKKVTMLPQEPWLSLDPIMPIDKQMGLVETLVCQRDKTSAHQRVKKRLAHLGIGKDGHKVPSQLSGGMAQRAAYLCATAAGGEILIADEPTKGLDQSRAQQVTELLQQHSQHKALLTITHDIDVARALKGEVIVMRHGVIVERGDSEQVLNAPQSDYAKQLISAHQADYSPFRAPSSSQPVLLSASKLTKQRGGKTLFRDLSLSIREGEILGISGDSGAGKSTLADILLGLTSADSGEVVRDDTLAVGKALKLYQDPPAAFAQTLTLGKHLNDLCQLHQLDSGQIAPLLEQLKLSESLLTRKPGQVSGGELQRFAMLRALIMQPKLIVADEPTSRLDPLVGYQTMTLFLEQVTRVGCATLLISHDIAMLKQVCHRVIYIEDLQGSEALGSTQKCPLALAASSN